MHMLEFNRVWVSDRPIFVHTQFAKFMISYKNNNAIYILIECVEPPLHVDALCLGPFSQTRYISLYLPHKCTHFLCIGISLPHMLTISLGVSGSLTHMLSLYLSLFLTTMYHSFH